MGLNVSRAGATCESVFKLCLAGGGYDFVSGITHHGFAGTNNGFAGTYHGFVGAYHVFVGTCNVFVGTCNGFVGTCNELFTGNFYRGISLILLPSYK